MQQLLLDSSVARIQVNGQYPPFFIAFYSTRRRPQHPPTELRTMHGQRRSEYKSRLLNPETSSKLATKAQQWNHLSHELLTQRRRLLGPTPPPASADNAAADGDGNGIGSKPSPEILLTLTEKMLSVNPDPSHLWNIRRELLLYVPRMDEDTGIVTDLDRPSASIPNLDIQSELKLTAHCLQRNPKAYSAWHRE